MRQGRHDNGAIAFTVTLVLSSLAEMQERGEGEERAMSQRIKAVTSVSPTLGETKERAAMAARHWRSCDYRVAGVVATGKDEGERRG